ncbi:MerR family transcriptional regulator [Streptomyces albiaxialis]|uniref:MerR family transcriptional regulator n=1 Tax=Streptomyces albiaxialis TaxID=329523 RepID=UPI0031CEF18B
MNGVAVQIGELAERTGASRRSLRYYEQHGLLHPRRSPKGWREYDEDAVDRVRNVRELLAAGLTLEDIQDVAPCLEQEHADFLACEDVAHAIGMYEKRLAVLDERAAELERYRGEIADRLERLRTIAERAHAEGRGAR